MLILASVVTAILFFLHLYLRWKDDYWLKLKIPFLEPKLLVGNIQDVILMKKTIGETYRDIYNKLANKPLGGFFNFTTPVLMIRHPKLVQDVLETKFHNFDANDVQIMSRVDKILKMNPYVLSGPQWKASREILLPSQREDKLKSIVPFLIPVCREMVNFIDQGNGIDIDVKDLSGKYTTDVMGGLYFGADVHSFTHPSSKFREMTRRLFNSGVKSNIALLCAFYAPTLGNLLRLRIIPKTVAEYFIGVVTETCRSRIKENIKKNDFIQELIEINKESEADGEGTAFNYQQIAAHCIAFLFDGYYSSGVTLCFCLHDLARHPEAQEKLREEAQKIISTAEEITYEKIQDLTYMDLFIQESMRLHPPIQILTRRCTESTSLSFDGLDYEVKKGTSIAIPIYALHMDEEHFPDPEKFHPERFLQDSAKLRHSYTYLPFGGGPRACLAAQSAKIMLKVALLSVVLNYEVSTKTPENIQLDPLQSFFTTPKGKVILQFKKL